MALDWSSKSRKRHRRLPKCDQGKRIRGKIFFWKEYYFFEIVPTIFLISINILFALFFYFVLLILQDQNLRNLCVQHVLGHVRVGMKIILYLYITCVLPYIALYTSAHVCIYLFCMILWHMTTLLACFVCLCGTHIYTHISNSLVLVDFFSINFVFGVYETFVLRLFFDQDTN